MILTLPRSHNTPYCLPHDSNDVSFREFCIRSTNSPVIDIFFFTLITGLLDIILILSREIHSRHSREFMVGLIRLIYFV